MFQDDFPGPLLIGQVNSKSYSWPVENLLCQSTGQNFFWTLQTGSTSHNSLPWREFSSLQRVFLSGHSLNPVSPNSDQQQFSPNNIHTLSRDKVMRINKMIIIEKIPWSFIKFSQLILKGDVRNQFGEFVCGYWGLKG